jgi:hypothetical protein
VWGYLLTFFSGPKACIRLNFSLVEYAPFLVSADVMQTDGKTKLLLHALLTKFDVARYSR